MTMNFFEEPETPQWTLADVYADIVGREEVCRRLNITPYRMARWLSKERRERLKVPKPIKRVSGTDLYSMQEWADWFERWQRRLKAGTKWTDEALPHGKNEPFFTYKFLP